MTRAKGTGDACFSLERPSHQLDPVIGQLALAVHNGQFGCGFVPLVALRPDISPSYGDGEGRSASPSSTDAAAPATWPAAPLLVRLASGRRLIYAAGHGQEAFATSGTGRRS